MIKDTDFYNDASDSYSSTRYPEKASTYNQFFFKERLNLLLNELRSLYQGKSGLSLLEIGCADGIVIRRIKEAFAGTFSRFVGIDISPDMISVAKKDERNKGIIFSLRSDYNAVEKYDLVIEIGVINYADPKEEVAFSSDRLKSGSYYICSVAGTDSLWNKLVKVDKGFNSFLSYKKYEAIFKESFTIEKIMPVGFFIPLIWRAPFIARIVQPLVEAIFRYILPNLFHEKVYVLKKK